MENKKNLLIGAAVLAFGLFAGICLGAEYRTCSMGDRHDMAGQSSMDHGGMQGMMMNMSSNLDGKTGDAFDEAFLNEMIVHHEGAVMMAESALKSAKHSEIKNMANEIIDAQTREIRMMEEWLKNWYGR